MACSTCRRKKIPASNTEHVKYKVRFPCSAATPKLHLVPDVEAKPRFQHPLLWVTELSELQHCRTARGHFQPRRTAHEGLIEMQVLFFAVHLSPRFRGTGHRQERLLSALLQTGFAVFSGIYKDCWHTHKRFIHTEANLRIAKIVVNAFLAPLSSGLELVIETVY